MFELGKTLNVDKKSFVLAINEFWGCVGLSFEEYCWLVLVWRSGCKKRNVRFSKGKTVKILSKLLFLFWPWIKL